MKINARMSVTIPLETLKNPTPTLFTMENTKANVDMMGERKTSVIRCLGIFFWLLTSVFVDAASEESTLVVAASEYGVFMIMVSAGLAKDDGTGPAS